jgi:LysR family transcriptional regulator, mexEF-oprN operon transcriptional activator
MDFDLNLLKTFVTVAEERSVTRAASRLYVTQPAVSASLRRLTEVVGTDLFVRQGRGLTLTRRGEQLFSVARHHLTQLTEATIKPSAFEPSTSQAVIRLGLSDGSGSVILPRLQAMLRQSAPNMRLVVVDVQFRTIEGALLDGNLTAAVCVADPLPKSILREPLDHGGHVGIYDSRHGKHPRTISEARYFACEHVIVSYAGDLRGIIEDTFGKTRNIRISVPSFNYLAEALNGTPLFATIPVRFADYLVATYPFLRTTELPFTFPATSLDLLWTRATDDDPAAAFIRDLLRRTLPVRSSKRGGRGGSSKARRSP